MLLHLRLNKKIESKGFINISDNLRVYILGYIVWNNTMYWGEEFAPILVQHYKDGEIEKYVNLYNGIYYFIIIDDKKIKIVNDRYGFYPLMYKRAEQEIRISNTSNDLINSDDGLNENALIEYFVCGFTIGNKTLVENIFEFSPHCIYDIEVRQGEFIWKEKSYWKFGLNLSEKLNNNKYQEFNELINRHFLIYSKFLKGKGNRVLLPISGGLDSRFLLNEFDKRDINSMLITFGGNYNTYDLKCGIELGTYTKNSLGHFVHINTEELVFNLLDNPVPSNKIASGQLNELFFYGINYFKNEFPYFISGQSGGFVTGSHMRLKMKHWKTKGDVIDYIFKYKTSTFANILSGDHKEYLKNQIEKAVSGDTDLIGMLYIWELENRQKKYMARYCFTEGDNYNLNILMPFYNYELFDFFTSLPFNELLNQKFFIKSMSDFLFKNNPGFLRVKRENRPIHKVKNHYIAEYLPKVLGEIRSILNKPDDRKSFIDKSIEWDKMINRNYIPPILYPYLDSKNIGDRQFWSLFQIQTLMKEYF